MAGNWLKAIKLNSFARVSRKIRGGARFTKISDTQIARFQSLDVAVVEKPVQAPVVARRIVRLA